MKLWLLFLLLAPPAAVLGCVSIYNRLDSPADVTQGELNLNGNAAIQGSVNFVGSPASPLYSGFLPAERLNKDQPDNYIKFTGLALGASGLISFWYTPSYNGPNDAELPLTHVVDILSYGIPNQKYGLGLAVNDWYPHYVVWGIKGTTPTSLPDWDYGYYQTIPELQQSPFNFPHAGQPVYITLLWDFTGSRTVLSLYINGAKVNGIPLGSLHNPVAGWTNDYELRIGSRMISGDWERHHWEGGSGVIGQLRVASGCRDIYNLLKGYDYVQSSELGPAGVDVGPLNFVQNVLLPYLGGFQPTPRPDHNTPDNHVKFPSLVLGASGQISFWYTPNYNGDELTHVDDIFSYGIPDQKYGLGLAVNDWSPHYVVWGIKGTAATTSTAWDYGFYQLISELEQPPFNFPIANKPAYFTLVWDFSGEHTVLSLFINGAKVTGIALGDSLHNPVSAWTNEYELRIGSRMISGDFDRHHWDSASGILGDLFVSSGNFPAPVPTELACDGKFRCTDGRACVSWARYGDGVCDCEDGSDEFSGCGPCRVCVPNVDPGCTADSNSLCNGCVNGYSPSCLVTQCFCPSDALRSTYRKPDAPCRPCVASDPGCTHPGVADQTWCDTNCFSIGLSYCPPGYCFCGDSNCTNNGTDGGSTNSWCEQVGSEWQQESEQSCSANGQSQEWCNRWCAAGKYYSGLCGPSECICPLGPVPLCSPCTAVDENGNPNPACTLGETARGGWCEANCYDGKFYADSCDKTICTCPGGDAMVIIELLLETNNYPPLGPLVQTVQDVTGEPDVEVIGNTEVTPTGSTHRPTKLSTLQTTDPAIRQFTVSLGIIPADSADLSAVAASVSTISNSSLLTSNGILITGLNVQVNVQIVSKKSSGSGDSGISVIVIASVAAVAALLAVIGVAVVGVVIARRRRIEQAYARQGIPVSGCSFMAISPKAAAAAAARHGSGSSGSSAHGSRVSFSAEVDELGVPSRRSHSHTPPPTASAVDDSAKAEKDASFSNVV